MRSRILDIVNGEAGKAELERLSSRGKNTILREILANNIDMYPTFALHCKQWINSWLHGLCRWSALLLPGMALGAGFPGSALPFAARVTLLFPWRAILPQAHTYWRGLALSFSLLLSLEKVLPMCRRFQNPGVQWKKPGIPTCFLSSNKGSSTVSSVKNGEES